MSDSIFMETTQISAERTTGEISELLSRYGAQAVMTEFSAGLVAGVSFRIELNGTPLHFKLPCRWEAVEAMLLRRRRGSVRGNAKAELEKKARRIAMRHILRWVEAQMAMVQTGQVKIQEVFLPYAMNRDGKTLYEHMEAAGFAAITHKKEGNQ